MTDKKERTSEDVLLGTPVKVSLGGRDYEIKPLRVGDNIAWRKKCGDLVSFLIDDSLLELLKDAKSADTDEDDAKIGLAFFRMFVPKIFGEGYDMAIDLMFAYSDVLSIDKERILKEATDEELINAALVCFEFGFPFVVSLVSAALRMQAKFQKTKISTPST